VWNCSNAALTTFCKPQAIFVSLLKTTTLLTPFRSSRCKSLCSLHKLLAKQSGVQEARSPNSKFKSVNIISWNWTEFYVLGLPCSSAMRKSIHLFSLDTWLKFNICCEQIRKISRIVHYCRESDAFFLFSSKL